MHYRYYIVRLATPYLAHDLGLRLGLKLVGQSRLRRALYVKYVNVFSYEYCRKSLKLKKIFNEWYNYIQQIKSHVIFKNYGQGQIDV